MGRFIAASGAAAAVLALAGCGRSSAVGAGASAPSIPLPVVPVPTSTAHATPTPPPPADLDGDGLPDAHELQLAADYLPYLSVAPDDGCATGGMLVRVRPHPADPTKIAILYDHLYDQDCGAFGHAGDDEAFGVTIDPNVAAPAGILAIIAISHQGTICERDTECGSLPGMTPCETTPWNGAPWPIVYSSKDKHGSYVDSNVCQWQSCFDTCELAPAPDALPIANAGEPGAPLVLDLTTAGFVTQANGWTQAQLFHFDPWDTTKTFGGAGNLAGDLVDPSYVTAP